MSFLNFIFGRKKTDNRVTLNQADGVLHAPPDLTERSSKERERLRRVQKQAQEEAERTRLLARRIHATGVFPVDLLANREGRGR